MQDKTTPSLLRALAALVLATALGVGGYLAGRQMTDGPAARQAEPASSTPSYDGSVTTAKRGPASTHPRARSRGARTSPSPAPPSGTPSPTPTPTPTSAPTTRPTPTGAAGPAGGGGVPAPVLQSPSPSEHGATPSTGGSATHAAAPAADTTPPETHVSTAFPSPDSVVATLTASESATFACSLDGAAYEPCGSPQRYSDLAAGWHTLAVRATDRAGNADPTPAESRWHSHKGPGGHP